MSEELVLSSIKITGTMVAYYHICDRKLWLFSRGLDFENIAPVDNVIIGKLISEKSYKRQKYKEVHIGDASIDFIEFKDQVIVHEVKKSPKFQESHIWQVKYYIYLLKKAGFNVAGGVIHYPRQKRKIDITFNEDDTVAIKESIEGIKEIITAPTPPLPVKKVYCKNCSYYEFCYI